MMLHNRHEAKLDGPHPHDRCVSSLPGGLPPFLTTIGSSVWPLKGSIQR